MLEAKESNSTGKSATGLGMWPSETGTHLQDTIDLDSCTLTHLNTHTLAHVIPVDQMKKLSEGKLFLSLVYFSLEKLICQFHHDLVGKADALSCACLKQMLCHVLVLPLSWACQKLFDVQPNVSRER
jgi:hypothetical protein